MLQLTLGNEQALLPDSWEAAGTLAWQLLRDLCRLPPGEGKHRALRRLTGLTPRDWRRLTEGQLLALDAGTPWLGITAIDTPLRTTMNCGLRQYYWPAAAFLDGQMLAFTLADEYFGDAMEAQGEEAVDAQLHLLACLAVPLERRGKRRPIADRAEVEDRAATFRRLAPEWQAQALMYWTGVKVAVHDLYGEYLFKQDDAGGPDYPSTAPHYGWASTLQDVAEAGAFGDLQAVHRANAHEVLQYLARKEGQRRDQQRYYDSINKK